MTFKHFGPWVLRPTWLGSGYYFLCVLFLLLPGGLSLSRLNKTHNRICFIKRRRKKSWEPTLSAANDCRRWRWTSCNYVTIIYSFSFFSFFLPFLSGLFGVDVYSTRVIKLACGPDIGRVVKIRKQAAAVFPPRRDRGDTSPPTSGGGVHPTSQHHHHHRGGSSSLSSTTAPSSLSSSSSSLSSLYPSSTYHNSSSHVQQQQNGSGGGGGGLGRSSTSSPSLGGQRTTSNAISPLPRSAASPSYPTASSISSNSSMTSSSSKLSIFLFLI